MWASLCALILSAVVMLSNVFTNVRVRARDCPRDVLTGAANISLRELLSILSRFSNEACVALSLPLLFKRWHCRTLKAFVWITSKVEDAYNRSINRSSIPSLYLLLLFCLRTLSLCLTEKPKTYISEIIYFVALSKNSVTHSVHFWNNAWVKRLLMNDYYVFHKITWKLNAARDQTSGQFVKD